MPAISTKLANCALWWSLRNCSTGTTPSGQMSSSSSSPAVSCTFWMYLGKHDATYTPKSVKLVRVASFGFLTVAVDARMFAHYYQNNRNWFILLVLTSLFSGSRNLCRQQTHDQWTAAFRRCKELDMKRINCDLIVHWIRSTYHFRSISPFSTWTKWSWGLMPSSENIFLLKNWQNVLLMQYFYVTFGRAMLPTENARGAVKCQIEKPKQHIHSNSNANRQRDCLRI